MSNLQTTKNIARTGLIFLSSRFLLSLVTCSFVFSFFQRCVSSISTAYSAYIPYNIRLSISVKIHQSWLFIVPIELAETPSGLSLQLVPTRTKAITWMGSSSYTLIHEDTQVQVILPLRTRIEDMRYLNRLSYAGPSTLPESVSCHISLPFGGYPADLAFHLHVLSLNSLRMNMNGCNEIQNPASDSLVVPSSSAISSSPPRYTTVMYDDGYRVGQGGMVPKGG